MDRTFKAVDRNGKEVEFELRVPTLAQDNKAEMERLKAYSEALKEGVLPREKMREILRQHEVWSEKEDESLSDYVREVAKLEKQLREESAKGNNAECTNIAAELSRQRLMMFRTFMVQQTVLTNSCEGMAELVKLEALMASCVFYKDDGEQYWDTYKDYVLERDFNEDATVAIAAQELQAALQQEEHEGLVSEYPEQEWVKNMSAKLTAQMESELERARQDVSDKLEAAVEREKEGADEVQAEADQPSDDCSEEGAAGGVEEVSDEAGELDSDQTA